MTGIEPLVYFLIYALIAGLFIYLAAWVLNLLNTPQPVKQIILIILALVFLLWILRSLGIFSF